VITYVDSSVLARAYLADETGAPQARRLLDDPSVGKVTGPWTRIEVSGAIVRAVRAGRKVDSVRALARLDADLDDGRVVVISAPLKRVEAKALELARTHGLRALDNLHLALASLAIPPLADRGEPIGFASRDSEQADVAATLGFVRI
jgi:predicted nucleic acid-binding protein